MNNCLSNNSILKNNLDLLYSISKTFTYKDTNQKTTTKFDYSLQDKSCWDQFLDQIYSDLPICIKDEYNINELLHMCSRLRTSKNFGQDNKLYLEYSSIDDFYLSLSYIDWTPVLKTGKICFVLDQQEKNNYLNQEKKDVSRISSLSIDEIDEIIITIAYSASGSDFFNMIFDFHPMLLTIGWHGISGFVGVYKVFLENKLAVDAVEHMRHPQNDNESKIIKRNIYTMLKYKHDERIQDFYKYLLIVLDKNQKYSISEWFKAFFLSSNLAVGRKFEQRIAPIIFYDRHGGIESAVPACYHISERDQKRLLNDDIFSTFKYRKYIGVIRHPTTRIGSIGSYFFKKKKPQYLKRLLVEMSEDFFPHYYVSKDDKYYSYKRFVRFEDLKLYPKDTILKICQFLNIIYYDTMLNLTTNGDDSGVVDGTAGFDSTPVYKKHLEFFSVLDYFRIELVGHHVYGLYNYKSRYYRDELYTTEDLKKLFAVPFKIETEVNELLTTEEKNEVKQIRENLLNIIINNTNKEKINNSNVKTKEMMQIECLYPDVNSINNRSCLFED